MAGALSGEVNIPKVGKFPKSAVVIGVGGVIVLIVYQNRKNASSAAAASSAGTGAQDPNAVDPATGLTYGQEQAAAAGGGGYYGGGGSSATGLQTSASYPWDGTYDNPNDPYSMDSATGQTYGTEGYSGSTSSYSAPGTGGPPFSTNAQWSQYALNYFTTNQFGDIQGMTDALGAYLAGQTVNSLQQGYINDATAIAGQPPVAGPGGYPPSIRTAGSVSGPKPPVPANLPATTSGGHVVRVNNNDATVAWTGHNAVRYVTVIHGPGRINGHTGRTTVPQASFSGLEAGHTYDVTVTPYNAAGQAGRTGTITLVTTR